MNKFIKSAVGTDPLADSELSKTLVGEEIKRLAAKGKELRLMICGTEDLIDRYILKVKADAHAISWWYALTGQQRGLSEANIFFTERLKNEPWATPEVRIAIQRGKGIEEALEKHYSSW